MRAFARDGGQMKIGIVADTHFGYSRFEEDAFMQAEAALRDAEQKADAIILAGDVFDSKIPRLETIKRAADIFSKIEKPIFVIHGNHERRSKGMTNAVQLLSSLGELRYLHAQTEVIEIQGEKASITCMGSVPEDLASSGIRKVAESEIGKIPKDAFKILVIHQSLSDIIRPNDEELCIDALESLPFDLIINGHIHKYQSELGGRLLIPGSTVITQLRSDEQGERGYILYNTKTRTHEFVKIPARQFFYMELRFENAGMDEVKERIAKTVEDLQSKNENPVIKIRISGTLREGLASGDLSFLHYDGVYLQNDINMESIREKIMKIRESREEKLSIREAALRQLGEKLRGKVRLFNPTELFEKLVESPDSAEQYLKKEKRESKA